MGNRTNPEGGKLIPKSGGSKRAPKNPGGTWPKGYGKKSGVSRSSKTVKR